MPRSTLATWRPQPHRWRHGTGTSDQLLDPSGSTRAPVHAAPRPLPAVFRGQSANSGGYRRPARLHLSSGIAQSFV